MYDVGFGDCFLVFVPTPKGTRKILFDCGTIAQGAAKLDQVVEQVIDDCREGARSKPRLHVIVATHRHADHISGFARGLWDEVQVDEVWMPWTEDPDDPIGTEVRRNQEALARRLAASLAARLEGPPQSVAEGARVALLRELAVNALTNDAAMARLHEGFGGRPLRRYLPTLEERGLIKSDALPGASIWALGPPRDKKALSQMDPPLGKGYLQLWEAEDSEGNAPEPFKASWWMEAHEWSSVGGHLTLEENDRQDIRNEVNAGVDELLAATLESSLNNTSLMLLLEIGGARLVFPGDAQWGPWRLTLGNDRVKRLLARTAFYKIGHHGSHNATPVEFVEGLPPSVCAMVSTRSRGSWPVPNDELMTAIQKYSKGKVLRSDKPILKKGTFRRIGPFTYETLIRV